MFIQSIIMVDVIESESILSYLSFQIDFYKLNMIFTFVIFGVVVVITVINRNE